VQAHERPLQDIGKVDENAMDLGRIALLFVVPPFLLGWFGPHAITKAIVLVSLAAGSVFTIAAWIRHSPEETQGSSRPSSSAPWTLLLQLTAKHISASL
jgi:hypothetical protein